MSIEGKGSLLGLFKALPNLNNFQTTTVKIIRCYVSIKLCLFFNNHLATHEFKQIEMSLLRRGKYSSYPINQSDKRKISERFICNDDSPT